MNKREKELFMQKLIDKVVCFYYDKVKEEYGGEGYDTNEESFSRALAIVTSTAFVSLDYENGRVFLYALDPMAFLPVNVHTGKTDLWDYLRHWSEEDYKVQIALGKFEMSDPHGEPIYKFTKEYLLETKRMVDDEAMTFQEAFLED